MNKKRSLRQAINEKCRDCIWDPKAGLGSWRQQVEGCTMTDCSLWPVRPISSAKSAISTGKHPKALRRYQEKRIADKSQAE